MKHKRTCQRCKEPILKTHRWRTVYHKFLWFTWQTSEHRDCAHPSSVPKVKRLKGEVPLPFDQQIERDAWNHGAIDVPPERMQMDKSLKFEPKQSSWVTLEESK